MLISLLPRNWPNTARNFQAGAEQNGPPQSWTSLRRHRVRRARLPLGSRTFPRRPHRPSGLQTDCECQHLGLITSNVFSPASVRVRLALTLKVPSCYASLGSTKRHVRRQYPGVSALGCGGVFLYAIMAGTRKWRNWQTRQT